MTALLLLALIGTYAYDIVSDEKTLKIDLKRVVGDVKAKEIKYHHYNLVDDVFSDIYNNIHSCKYIALKRNMV